MQLIFIVLILCLVLFLFRLYHLAIDDYVLIKKNVNLDDIFNAAFVCSLFALFFARVFYIGSHFSTNFLNPLVFLVFPYFPGLSLLGGLLGGGVTLFLYGRARKFPIKRVFDFFTVAVLFTMPIGLIGYIFLSGLHTHGQIVRLVLLILLLLFTNLYLYPKAHSLEIKDGSLSMIFVIFYSLISLLSTSMDNPGLNNFIANKENFLQIGILIVAVLLIGRQEILGRFDIGK